MYAATEYGCMQLPRSMGICSTSAWLCVVIKSMDVCSY